MSDAEARLIRVVTPDRNYEALGDSWGWDDDELDIYRGKDSVLTVKGKDGVAVYFVDSPETFSTDTVKELLERIGVLEGELSVEKRSAQGWKNDARRYATNAEDGKKREEAWANHFKEVRPLVRKLAHFCLTRDELTELAALSSIDQDKFEPIEEVSADDDSPAPTVGDQLEMHAENFAKLMQQLDVEKAKNKHLRHLLEDIAGLAAHPNATARDEELPLQEIKTI